MKRVHLLRVEADAKSFEGLVSAVRDDGGRVGWLELGDADPPWSLAGPTGAGVARAVAAGARHTISVKPRSGAPVLRDLVREHFLGCRVVLIRGEIDAPALTVDGETWTGVRGDAAKSYSVEELVRALRAPRPFD